MDRLDKLMDEVIEFIANKNDCAIPLSQLTREEREIVIAISLLNLIWN